MKFSVIIPAYNSEQYIAKAIESCLNQTYAPHEIIVIDDASTDRTVAVAESFPAPVRVIRLSENSGVSVARNTGVAASTGDWLAFLDADDWFLPEKLERQRQCALQNERAILIYTGFVTSRNGLETPARFIPPTVLEPMLRYRCAFAICSVVLRRDVFDSVGGFDPTLRGVEDWDLWLRLAARYSVESFAALPEVLFVYHITPGSLSSNAMRMSNMRASLVETKCLYGTSGLKRHLWRRRIFAFQHYDAAIAQREEGSQLDLSFIFRSICYWPFPWREMPRRYMTAAVMAKQHSFKRVNVLLHPAQRELG